jgi:hypothetical protein
MASSRGDRLGVVEGVVRVPPGLDRLQRGVAGLVVQGRPAGRQVHVGVVDEAAVSDPVGRGNATPPGTPCPIWARKDGSRPNAAPAAWVIIVIWPADWGTVVPGLKSDPIIVRARHSSDHKVNRASPAKVGK